jgi:hypothetical protein
MTNDAWPICRGSRLVPCPYKPVDPDLLVDGRCPDCQHDEREFEWICQLNEAQCDLCDALRLLENKIDRVIEEFAAAPVELERESVNARVAEMYDGHNRRAAIARKLRELALKLAQSPKAVEQLEAAR